MLFKKREHIFNFYINSSDDSPYENAIAVKEEFNIYAATTMGFWFLFKKMWRLFFISIVVFVALFKVSQVFGIDEMSVSLMQFLIILLIGLEANYFYGKYLTKKGYRHIAKIYAKDRFEAERIFIESFYIPSA